MEQLTNEQYEELAYEKFTLPRFIFKRNGEIQELSAVFSEIDCVSKQGQLINPLNLYSLINGEAEIKLNLSEFEILKLFTLVNKRYVDLVFPMSKPMIEAFLLSQGEVGETLIKLWEERDQISSVLRREIDQFREHFSQKLRQKLVLDNAPSFLAESLVETSRNLTRAFKKNTTLLDIFNDTPVSADLPLIVSRDYFKVLKGFAYALDPPEDEDILHLFFKGEKIILRWNRNFTDPEFELTQKQDFLGQLDDLLGIKDAVIVRQKQNATVSLYAPDFRPFDFNRYIWAEMIMNNPSVSSQFVVNEHGRILSSRSIIPMIYFPQGASASVEAELKAKKQSFSIRDITGIDRAKSGKFLTKIDVKLNDWTKEEIETFIPKLCKVFGLYLAEQKRIAAIYNKLLDLKIKIIIPTQEEKKKRLKDIEPKLFLPGYVRNQCQFAPEIVEEEEDVKEFEEKGFQVMKFPKTENEGLEQRFYVCSKYERNIYPGLQDNKLANRDKYKYIPCCFKDDQRLKGTNYRFYLDPKIAIDKGKRAGFIETDKILSKGQKGNPPFKLKQLFSLLNLSDSANQTVIRIGTTRSPASILECISGTSQIDQVRVQLSEFASKNNALSVSAQEIATIGGLKAAQEILKNKNAYLDPRVFYRFFELYFDCRLILLGRDDFIFPNYTHTFAHFYTEKQILVAYENFGGSVENAEFPQWEYFQGIDNISERLYAIYSKDFFRYKTGRSGEIKILQEVSSKENPAENIKVHSQYLSNYRQTIALNVSLGSGPQITYILKEPIAPLPIPISLDDVVYPETRAPKIDPIPVPYNGEFFLIRGAFPLKKAEASWLADYVDMKIKSNVLVEQAIHLASQSASIRIGKMSTFSLRDWTKKITVPARVATKLKFSVDLFRKNNPEEFSEHKKYKVIPNRFTSMIDFERHSEEIVSKVDMRVDWNNVIPVIESRPIVGKTFYIELNDGIYFCTPKTTESLQDAKDINVCIFNTREIFSIGSPKSKNCSAMFFLTAVGEFHIFSCKKITSE